MLRVFHFIIIQFGGDTWEHKGSATEFDTKEYYKTLAKAYKLKNL